jgi:hypothetical protein
LNFCPPQGGRERFIPGRSKTRNEALEHDPDPKGRVSAKWKPVFPRDKRATRLRGDHAQIKRKDHDAIPLNRIMI